MVAPVKTGMGVPMAAYIVGHFTIDDEDAYGRYAEAFFPVFDKYGGELVAVDDQQPIVEGTAPPGRTVILRFSDLDTAKAFWNSVEYQEIAEHRRAGTTPSIIPLIGDRPEGWTGP
jgi:uncharacterized protein (DUF1330 family)